MAQAVAAATSGWGHIPWIVPRFAAGFILVFVGAPIVLSLHSPGALVNPNYPFDVFFNYWTWLAVDLNHLWAAAAASAIIGFIAADLIHFWNGRVNKALPKKVKDCVRCVVKISPRENPEMQERSGGDERKPTDAENAKFRIWLFGYENGAPAKYLDWHGLNKELRGEVYHGLFILFQLWSAWGIFNLVTVLRSGLRGWWMIQVGIEWFVIWVVLCCASFVAYKQYDGWKRVVDKTWAGLWATWEEIEKKKSTVSQ
ncbi:MAG: hypothetical protein JRN33_05820 [Nitrososphaerota archaeon]|nr:hypothetical protein [Nitrososphaerota archaeon]